MIMTENYMIALLKKRYRKPQFKYFKTGCVFIFQFCYIAHGQQSMIENKSKSRFSMSSGARSCKFAGIMGNKLYQVAIPLSHLNLVTQTPIQHFTRPLLRRVVSISPQCCYSVRYLRTLSSL